MEFHQYEKVMRQLFTHDPYYRDFDIEQIMMDTYPEHTKLMYKKLSVEFEEEYIGLKEVECVDSIEEFAEDTSQHIVAIVNDWTIYLNSKGGV